MTVPPSASALSITTPSETEPRWARRFRAPIARVFEALTQPALVQRWLLGPEASATDRARRIAPAAVL
jgi:uncharacterized protein YndB with AHSA1/START domain